MKIGVAGLGMMGLTHLDVYAKRDDVEVVAVADLDEGRRTGRERAAGNVEGQAQDGFDFGSVRQYADAAEMIADPSIDLIDICLPTPLHLRFGKLALESGKHLLVEKPLARTADEARQLAEAAERSDRLSMCAMCMRFWPGWDWLKEAVDQKTYGKVLAATFSRLADHPGGPFYSDGEACGGAVLDLHIHDSDFIQYVFGMPEAVTTRGYSSITGRLDHVLTQYHHPDVPLLTAEGGWAMSKGYGFKMRYSVNFEHATAVFDLGAVNPLTLQRPGEDPEPIPLNPEMGYAHEITYFLDCLAAGRKPERVTLSSAADSVRLIEAEVESATRGETVRLT